MNYILIILPYGEILGHLFLEVENVVLDVEPDHLAHRQVGDPLRREH